MAAPDRSLEFLKTSLNLNGLVHQSGEVMHQEHELDVSLESLKELFLLTSISYNVFLA